MKDNEQQSKKTVNDQLFEDSGKVKSNDPLVCFLYLMMRDEMPIGEVTALYIESTKQKEGFSFTNGYLAEFAKYLAKGLHANVNAEQSKISA